jgi:hypothetical protein
VDKYILNTSLDIIYYLYLFKFCLFFAASFFESLHFTIFKLPQNIPKRQVRQNDDPELIGEIAFERHLAGGERRVHASKEPTVRKEEWRLDNQIPFRLLRPITCIRFSFETQVATCGYYGTDCSALGTAQNF